MRRGFFFWLLLRHNVVGGSREGLGSVADYCLRRGLWNIVRLLFSFLFYCSSYAFRKTCRKSVNHKQYPNYSRPFGPASDTYYVQATDREFSRRAFFSLLLFLFLSFITPFSFYSITQQLTRIPPSTNAQNPHKPGVNPEVAVKLLASGESALKR